MRGGSALGSAGDAHVRYFVPKTNEVAEEIVVEVLAHGITGEERGSAGEDSGHERLEQGPVSAGDLKARGERRWAKGPVGLLGSAGRQSMRGLRPLSSELMRCHALAGRVVVRTVGRLKSFTSIPPWAWQNRSLPAVERTYSTQRHGAVSLR